jgi:pimeloyl-ACP methyl ester carboxylesterase
MASDQGAAVGSGPNGHYPFRSAEARERYWAYYDDQAQAWPIASENRTVETADGQTFLRVSGPEDGPPLALLPGGRASSLCWTEMIEALSQEYRTYAVDGVYDVGRSVPSRPIKTTEDLTGWIGGLLDALGLHASVNLMGLSFGAYAGAEYVLQERKRISKAVWVSPAAIALNLSAGFILRSLPCLVPSRATFGSFTRWIMPGVSGRLYEDSITDMVIGAKCYVMRAWPGGGPRKFTDEELAAIDVPVLYMAGEEDRVCSSPSDAAARLASLMPAVETSLVPGVGHELFMLEPAKVSERALEFLRS